MTKYFINAVSNGTAAVTYEVTADAPRAGARTLRSQEVVSVTLSLGLRSRIELGLPLSQQDCDPEIWAHSADFRAEMPLWNGKLAREFIPADEIFSEYNSLAVVAQLRDQWWRGDAHPELYTDNGEAYVLTIEGQAMRAEARARRAEILAQIDAACVLFAVEQALPAAAVEAVTAVRTLVPAAVEAPEETSPLFSAEEQAAIAAKINADAEAALSAMLGGKWEEEEEEEEEETAIINLTQHMATAEQQAAGVVDFAHEIKAQVQVLLTFDTIPNAREINDRAALLAGVASEWGFDRAMIGGAPFLMSALESKLKIMGIQPVYAFSVRDSVEKQNPDGSVTKQNVFKHAGFIEA